MQVGNNVYTTSGNYTDVLTTVNGCDSTVNLNLTVHPVYTETLTEEICEGEGVQVGNNVYTTSGNYTDVLTTVNGCDSTVNLDLTVHPVYTETLTEEICEGEGVQVGNNVYTTSGNYTDVLTTVNGCDSTVNLNLTVHPVYTETLTEVICEGESVQVGNSVYTISGNYMDVLTTINGCDSTVNLSLTVNAIQYEFLDVALCSGENYNGFNYTSDTILIDSLIASTGCDSIVRTTITAHQVFDETVNVQVCEGVDYNGVAYSNDTTFVENLTTGKWLR